VQPHAAPAGTRSGPPTLHPEGEPEETRAPRASATREVEPSEEEGEDSERDDFRGGDGEEEAYAGGEEGEEEYGEGEARWRRRLPAAVPGAGALRAPGHRHPVAAGGDAGLDAEGAGAQPAAGGPAVERYARCRRTSTTG